MMSYPKLKYLLWQRLKEKILKSNCTTLLSRLRTCTQVVVLLCSRWLHDKTLNSGNDCLHVWFQNLHKIIKLDLFPRRRKSLPNISFKSNWKSKINSGWGGGRQSHWHSSHIFMTINKLLEISLSIHSVTELHSCS